MRHHHAKHLLMHMALAHHKQEPAPSFSEKLSHEKVIISMKEGIMREKQVVELTKEINELKRLLKEYREELTAAQQKRFLERLAVVNREINELEK